jgi:Sec-independent protein translocase protein TatA
MGWGQVARQLNVKLGRTVSQVRKTANNSNREIKADHARAGKAPKEAPQQEQRQERKAPDTPDVHLNDGKSLSRGRAQ